MQELKDQIVELYRRQKITIDKSQPVIAQLEKILDYQIKQIKAGEQFKLSVLDSANSLLQTLGLSSSNAQDLNQLVQQNLQRVQDSVANLVDQRHEQKTEYLERSLSESRSTYSQVSRLNLDKIKQTFDKKTQQVFNEQARRLNEQKAQAELRSLQLQQELEELQEQQARNSHQQLVQKQDYENQIQTLQQKLRQQQEQNSKKLQIILQMDGQMSEIKQQFSEKQMDLQQVNDEIDTQQKLLQNLLKEKEATQAVLIEQQVEMQNLQQVVGKQFASSNDIVVHLQQKLLDQQLELTAKQQLLKQKDEEICFLQQDNEDMDRDVEKLCGQLESQMQRIQQLQKQSGDDAQCEQLKAKIQFLESQQTPDVAKLLKQLDTATSELQSTRNQLQQLQNSSKAELKQLKSQNEQLTKVDLQNRVVIQQHGLEVADLKQQITQFQQLTSELRCQIDDLNKQLKQENQKHQREINKLQEDNEALKDQFQQEINELDLEIEQMSADALEMQQEAMQLDQKKDLAIQELEVQLEVQTGKLKQLLQENKQLKQSGAEMAQKMDLEQMINKKVKFEFDTLKQEIGAKVKVLQSAMGECKKQLQSKMGDEELVKLLIGGGMAEQMDLEEKMDEVVEEVQIVKDILLKKLV